MSQIHFKDGTRAVFYRNLSDKERLSKAYLEGLEEENRGIHMKSTTDSPVILER